MPPILEHESTEALLCRLTRLGDMHAGLTADASSGAIDQDDLVEAIKSTMRVIDCVLLERGAYIDDSAQGCRLAALTAANMSTNLRRWIDDLQIQTEAPRPTDQQTRAPLH